MKRAKRHRVKQEVPETSTSRPTNEKEQDLAYYIHDRVELMHQVFSVLKPKEIKAMAPECVRHISVNDLQELCMEELLGISSKRLCAILDGASPPSDTESSSESEQLETISLDSISSDEEILSEVSTKKSKKHKHRSKSKAKKRKSKDKDDEDKDQADRSRRAGLTVLELLELQARARAIRAQLQQEQASAVSTGRPSESVTGNSSDDEVEIKEEAAEVVEISSEDEKPNIQELEERVAASRKDTSDNTSNSTTVTKKVNDLIITVPKTNTSRKIKLKRNTGTCPTGAEKTPEKDNNPKNCVIIVEETSKTNETRPSFQINGQSVSAKTSVETNSNKNNEKRKLDSIGSKDKSKGKDKKKKKKRDKQKDKDGSDHDEITLQLSDTEKMDLLEDLDGKKSEKCSDTEDSCTDSSDEDLVKEDLGDKVKNRQHTTHLTKIAVNRENSKETISNKELLSIDKNFSNIMNNDDAECLVANSNDIADKKSNKEDSDTNSDRIEETARKVISEDKGTTSKAVVTDVNSIESLVKSPSKEVNITINTEEIKNDSCDENTVGVKNLQDKPLEMSEMDKTRNIEDCTQNTGTKPDQDIVISEERLEVNQDLINDKIVEVSEEINMKDIAVEHVVNKDQLTPSVTLPVIDKIANNGSNVGNRNKVDLNEKSDGELSDRDSSEVEASDFKPDVVCISDDEERKGKKKKKKDKKSKKEKKSKKKKDFRESADQNFYSENKINDPTPRKEVILIPEETERSKCYNDDIIANVRDYEDKKILIKPDTEADESHEVNVQVKDSSKSENVNTDVDFDDDVFEILELSDDSSCYEVEEISISKEPTADEIKALSAKLDELESDRFIHIETPVSNESEDLDKVSWKDRYLKSSKVKKVLTTANIMNAMRKKNLELKKKLHESKKEIEIEEDKAENNVKATDSFEDGSIEQYNTLETSTKYVDPVKGIENESEDKIADDKNETDKAKAEKDKVTKEMKKQAKQLLKMYKMLLKYNDMSRQKDPNRKKKRRKKSKEKHIGNQVDATN